MRAHSTALRRGLAVAAVGVVLATGAACTNEKTGTDPKGAPADDGVKYAACLRENGVRVDDPKQGETPRIPEGTPQSARDKAEKACGANPDSQAQAGSVGNPQAMNDPEVEALRLKADGCMRKNGYETPKPGSEGVINMGDPVYQSAMKACKTEWDAVTNKFAEASKKGASQ